MKKFETQATQGELQSAGENAEALISLTPEQLETVAGGFVPWGLVSDFYGVVRLLLRLL